MSNEVDDETEVDETVEQPVQPPPAAPPAAPPPAQKRGPGRPRKEAPPNEGQMKVELSGPADKVRKVMGLSAPEAPPTAPEDGGDPDSNSAIVEALRNPRNIFIVKRTHPAEIGGEKARGEVDRGECPTTINEIMESVAERYGGRRYRISVLDSRTNELVTAERFDVDVEPKLPGRETDEEKMRAIFGDPNATEKEESPLDEVADTFEKETKATAKKAELMKARALLAESREVPSKREDDPVIARLAQLERKMLEDKYANRIAELEREINAERTRPKKDEGGDAMVKMTMEFMRQQSEQTKALIQQMADQRMNQLMMEVRELRNRPEKSGNDFLSQVVAMKKVMGLLGLPGGDDDDDEESGEWYETLINKHVPRLLDMIETRRKEGKQLTKEEVIEGLKLEQYADKVAKEAIANQQQAMRAAAPGLPAPRPAAPATPAAGPAAVPDFKEAPATPPTPALASPPAPAPAEQKAPAELMSIEDEIKMRVANVLLVLEREMTLRPLDHNWTIVAWGGLPSELLEKVAASDSGVAALKAFEGIVKPDMLSQMSERMAQPKVETWFSRGLAELKDWMEQLKQDPNFDPLSDDDEDNEEETE